MFEFSENDKALSHLTNGGAFLTAGGTPNVMTISWGMLGVLWGQKVFLLPVRQSRYTKVKLDESDEFTVSVPFSKMGRELAFCGSRTGRDTDKLYETALTAVKARSVGTSIIDGCDYYFECSVLMKIPLTEKLIREELSGKLTKFYSGGDYHTLYIARVVDEYKSR
ncbi:MAG: flavin reductase family protein [Clostridiales bacterium]|jgi:flavin reductase (DIM6/NTAB) family NADH-FMN oxidoreductase RutF|nr:flavin reductase family protein [Clostridiales bacterium]